MKPRVTARMRAAAFAFLCLATSSFPVSGGAVLPFSLPLPCLHAESLDAFLSRTGSSARFDPLTRIGSIESGEKQARFIVGSGTLLLSNGEKRLVPAPAMRGTAIDIPPAFASAVEAFFRAPEEKSGFTIAAIVIDPGHGGKDPGAIATHGTGKKALTVVEKDVNLSVGLEVYARLRKAFPYKRVLITRSGDTFPELEDRVSLANSINLGKNEAIIFVSIHTNASLSKKASGYEVWYLDPDIRRNLLSDSSRSEYDPAIRDIMNDLTNEEYTSESIIIAKNIMESLTENIGKLSPNRGIKAAEWYVVKKARMPSVLVELGYLTNEGEARLLSDRAYLMKLSASIYNGLVSFISHFERSKGFTTE